MRRDQEPLDEFDDDDIDNSHIIKKDNQYFDDELPQKAVSGLFRGGAKTPIVNGYDDSEDEEEEASILQSRKRPAKSVEMEEEGGFVRGFERKAVQPTPQSQPKARPKALDDGDEEAFTLYRKKKGSTVNAKPAVTVAKSPGPASRTARQPSDRYDVDPEQEQDRGVSQPYEDDDYDAFKEKYKNREYIPSPKQPKAAPQKTSPYGGADYDDYEEEGDASGALKVALAIVSCVFLVILAVMVFKINSTSAQLKEADAKLKAVSDNEVQLETLKMEKDALKEERDRLQMENDELRSASVGAPQEGSEEGLDADADGSESNEAGTSSGERIHTVAQGDTLTKISQQYYGAPDQYDKIKQANNLTSNDLSVGQRLRIPD